MQMDGRKACRPLRNTRVHGTLDLIDEIHHKIAYFLVTNFDYKSQFSARHMQKLYGAKKMYIMPYNVDFKDYYTISLSEKSFASLRNFHRI